MIGALIVAVVIIFVLPALFMLLGLIVSALFGWSLRTDAEARYEGSEVSDLYQ